MGSFMDEGHCLVFKGKMPYIMKDPADFLIGRGCCSIPISNRAVQQHVPHRPTDQIGIKSGIIEPLNNMQDKPGDAPGINNVTGGYLSGIGHFNIFLNTG
jgi:hypothetical protein